MSSTGSKSMRVPSFDGKKAAFQMWWTKFRAFASVNKFAKAISETADPNLPLTADAVIDETTTTGVMQAAALARNNLAMSMFTIAFTSEKLMVLVYKCASDEWPNGTVHELVTLLTKKYMPKDMMSRVELRQELQAVKMNKLEDPANLFEKLSSIRNKFSKMKIDDEELIAIAISKAPREYAGVITSEQRAKGNLLDLDDLEETMCQQYRTVHHEEESDGEDNEFGLAGMENITCYRCGKPGHKANNCDQKESQSSRGNGGGKYTGSPCGNCGKSTHPTARCWDDPKNESKRPPWWKDLSKATEVAASVADNSDSGSESELMLMGIDTTFEFPQDAGMLHDPNVWLADTGASVHITRSQIGATNIQEAKGSLVTMGNGQGEATQAVMTLRGQLCNKNGCIVGKGTLTDVNHVPKADFNLFSITKMQQEGWLLGGDADSIWLTKDGRQLSFDLKIPTKTGMLFAIYFKRLEANPEPTELALSAVEGPRKRLNIKTAHDWLGHPNEDSTRVTAKELNWTITRGSLKCEACAAGKAKQKNVPKHSTHKPATHIGERIFLDISSIKQQKDGPKVAAKRHWRIIVDERTQIKFSDFYETKNGMIEPTCERINRWKEQNIIVKQIRMDNAGENVKLQQRCGSSDWKFAIEFEYTARDTPQQNHLAELGFATIANRGRALMHRANVPHDMRCKLFPKAFKVATMLDGLAVIKLNGLIATRYVHWKGSNPRFVNHLHTWGMAGTVKLKTKSTPKVDDRGVHCMYVGPAINHEADCYEMWDPITTRIHKTRDVIWLKRMFYERPATHPTVGTVLETDAFEDNVEQDEMPVLEEDEKDVGQDEGKVLKEDEKNVGPPKTGTKIKPKTIQFDLPDEENKRTYLEAATSEHPIKESDFEGEITFHREDEVEEEKEERTNGGMTRSGRTIKPPALLMNEYGAVGHTGKGVYTPYGQLYTPNKQYEIGLSEAENSYYKTMREIGELALVGAGLGGGFANTSELKVLNYKEAMASKEFLKWKEAVKQEHKKMVKYQVFDTVLAQNLPKGAKVMTSTWAMKMKANGLFRARMAARGYEQIDGKHYDSSSTASPVVTDVTIRIILVLMIMSGGDAQILDVCGAFLHGHFDAGEEIYMKMPAGFEEFYPEDAYLLMKRTLYGTKQAALQYWKESQLAFQDMKCQRSKADPCLYYKWDTEEGLILWISWVDDYLISGTTEGVKKSKQEMMDRFDCDDVGEMNEYVGCKVDYDKDLKRIRLTQPVMIQSFVDEFDLPKEANPKTPAAPGTILEKGEESEMLSHEDQQTYRSGVGKMLHMMRWSRPDILNAVRDLSRFMSAATAANLKAMKRVMQYVVATPDRGLTLQPDGVWNGSPSYEFEVSGMSDSEYGKDPSRKSVNGWSTYLNGAMVSAKSKMMPIIALSVTEAELYAATQCAQDMLFVMRILESIGLKVKKPMNLFVDNKGAVDLANNWSVGGRTRHVEVKQYFLRELKEQGLIRTSWRSGALMTSDVLTKNLAKSLFEKHNKAFVGNDPYNKVE